MRIAASSSAISARSFNRHDALFLPHKNAGHIRQVVLTMRIVRLQFADQLEEGIGLEGVDARVDFAHRFLLRRQRLLFHNGNHLRRSRPLADHPPIAKRIRRRSRQNGHRRPLSQVKVAQPRNRLRRQQRHIA